MPALTVCSDTEESKYGVLAQESFTPREAAKSVGGEGDASSRELPLRMVWSGEDASRWRELSAGMEELDVQKHPLDVLIVEDIATNKVVASMMLQRLGQNLRDWAKNGQEALELLARNSYDLILMDCQMPIMDGLQATEAIRSGKLEGVDPEIYISAMTANAVLGDRDRCFSSGMNDYLSKPLRRDALKVVLERALWYKITRSAAESLKLEL